MHRALLVLAFLVGVSSFSLGCAAHAAAGPASIFPAGTVERMNHGVFELVVPKTDDGNVTYTEPLPFDLVPYAQRNDKFRGLGTAFAISPRRFVTAAHVLNAYERQPFDKIFLRDARGVVHEVAAIVRYSQYRDLVEFEVADPPADVAPLEINTKVAIGDVVDTVGNAGGEGIVIRTGSVTSFVPEPVDGKWNFIRFTSDTSHGNSGGPLVDSEGHAVGVVVQKGAAENLNVAVPVAELSKLSTTKTEFLLRGAITIGDGAHHEFADWRFSSPLPTTYADLRAAAQRDLRETVDREYAAFLAKTAAQGFPADPGVPVLLREVQSSPPLGTYTRDPRGRWTVSALAYKEVPLSLGGALQLAETDEHRTGAFLLERPRGTTVNLYVKRPSLLGDLFVRSHALAVPFAGRAITIASLGVPEVEERWSDVYGRAWLDYVWRIPRGGESVVFACLTRPSGLACRWARVSLAQEDAARAAFKRAAAVTTLDYTGTIAEWEEYLGLAKSLRPRVLERAKVHARASGGGGTQVDFNVGPFAGSVDLEGVSRDSSFTALVSVDPAAPTAERVFGLRLVPDREEHKLAVFGVDEELEPVAASSGKHALTWKKLGSQTAPYDGNAVPEGKTNIASGLLQAGVPNQGKRIMYYCRAPQADPKAALETRCAQFRASLKAPAAKEEEP